MIDYEIEASGIDKVIQFQDRFAKSIKDRYGTYVEKVADDFVDEARSNVQNNGSIATGDLVSSIGILKNDGGLEITVGTTLFYAKWIEYGRGPVKPLDPNGVLHWIDKTTGEDVFSKYAKATEPMPFMAPAAIVIQHKFPRMIAALEQEYMKGELL